MLRDKIGVQVPQVLAEDKAAGVLILEDLGDADLCSLAQGPEFPWAPVASALEQVAGIHRLGVDAFAGSGVTLMEAVARLRALRDAMQEDSDAYRSGR